MEQNELMQGLVEDISGAKDRLASTQPADAMDYFEPKAMRIKGRIVGAKEMKAAQRAIDQVVQKLGFEAKLLNNEERGKMNRDLKKRLNQQRMFLMKWATEAQMQMAKKGLDQKTQQAIWTGIGAAVGGATELGVSSIGVKKPSVNLGGGGGGGGTAAAASSGGPSINYGQGSGANIFGVDTSGGF